MPLQSSGAISLADVQTEFGGSNPIGINEYYGVASGVPASGTISLADFYGKSGITPYTINVLILAGGGGGGSASDEYAGGGGGAGGLVIGSLTASPSGTYSYALVVGAGGYSEGSNSTFQGLTAAVGGGGGGNDYYKSFGPYNGTSGGSGGGAGYGHGVLFTGGAGTSGQGNAGGLSNSGSPPIGGGGGGGYSSAGGNNEGAGGSGYNLATFRGGSALGVAGGGGGGPTGSATDGGGSVGGTTDGPANRGGGGRGGDGDAGGSGGSGIVIVRYTGTVQKGTGGTVTTANVGGTDYVIHTFTASGTFNAFNNTDFWLLGEDDAGGAIAGGCGFLTGGTFTSANITATTTGSTTLSFTFTESSANVIQGSTSYIRLYKNSSQIFQFTRSQGLTTTYSASYNSGDVFYFETELYVDNCGTYNPGVGTIQVNTGSSLVYRYTMTSSND